MKNEDVSVPVSLNIKMHLIESISLWKTAPEKKSSSISIDLEDSTSVQDTLSSPNRKAAHFSLKVYLQIVISLDHIHC